MQCEKQVKAKTRREVVDRGDRGWLKKTCNTNGMFSQDQLAQPGGNSLHPWQ